MVAALWVWSGAREPSHQGKPLSFWLGELSGPDREGALEALDAIGPKAIPALLRRFQARDSIVKLQALRVAYRVGLIEHSRVVRGLASDRRREGAEGLIRLGERAKPAVPELLKLTEHDDSSIRALAWEVLAVVAGDEFEKHLRTEPMNAQAVETQAEDLSEKK